jgi:hypothetical protein
LVCTGVGGGAPGGGDDGEPLGCGEWLGCGEPLGLGDPLGEPLGFGDGDGELVDVAGQVCDRLNQFLSGATPVVVVTVPEPLVSTAPAVVTNTACLPLCRNVGPEMMEPGGLNVMLSVLNASVVVGRTKNQPSWLEALPQSFPWPL